MNITTITSYNIQDAYNADEAVFFYQMLPAKTHTMKGGRCTSGKKSKMQVTVLLCANVDGSDSLLPFVSGKYQKPQCSVHHMPVCYQSNLKM